MNSNLNAVISVNTVLKCTCYISQFRLDITEYNASYLSVIALLPFKLYSIKEEYIYIYIYIYICYSALFYMELETTDNVPVLFTRIIDDTTVRINFDGAELDGERNGDKFAVIDISVACSTVDISRNEDDLSVTLTMM